MPIIEVSETTFRRLQQAAVPFVDTPESVILRALEQYVDTPQAALTPPNAVSLNGSLPPGARILDPEKPGPIEHTKVIHARFGNRTADKWNELLIQAHAEARSRLGSFAAVRQASASAIVQGKRSESGFHHMPDLDLSIQYVDSNKAWEQTLLLAKRLGIAVEVQFRWREKEGARHPGEFGVLRWSPKA